MAQKNCYTIELLYDYLGDGDSLTKILAQVPFTIDYDEGEALNRAYLLAEHLAHQMFEHNYTIRSIPSQLHPIYFADAKHGDTISIK